MAPRTIASIICNSREIFEDGPSAKIGSLENFWPYGIMKNEKIWQMHVYEYIGVHRVYIEYTLPYYVCTFQLPESVSLL